MKETSRCPFCGSPISPAELKELREKITKAEDPQILREIEAIRDSIRNEERKKAEIAVQAMQGKLSQYQKRERELDQRDAQLKAREATVDGEVRKELAKREKALRDQVAAELSNKHKAEMQERKSVIEGLQKKLDEQQALTEQEVQRRVQEREKKIREEEKNRAEKTHEPLRAKLEEYANREAALLAKEEAITLREREIDLRVAREVAQKRDAFLAEARRQDEEKHGIELKEKDSMIGELRGQLEEAQRTIQAGSPQRRGDIQEEELGDILENAFPEDKIVRIASGQRGADVLQTVRSPQVGEAGSIYWESKRTKEFHPAWLGKLRQDQQDRKADVAALVSMVLPDELGDMGVMEGVVVLKPALVQAVAFLIRQYLLNIARQRLTLEQRGTKVQSLYVYMTGNTFLQRVAAVVDAQAKLSALNNRERRSHEKVWAEREQLHNNIGRNVAELYGDVEGIVGSLPPVEGLQLPPRRAELLPSTDEDEL